MTERKPPQTRYQRTCPVCGSEFETPYKVKRYCCQHCADIVMRMQTKPKPRDYTKPKSEREPEAKTKPGITVETAAKLQHITGQSYGKMFAPKVTVEIPEWARG